MQRDATFTIKPSHWDGNNEKDMFPVDVFQTDYSLSGV